jgi:hypothetical protein
MKENLMDELDFVGARKKIPWFTRDLTRHVDFKKFVLSIQKKRKDTTIRTTLYSLFPLSEYVAFLHGLEVDFKKGERQWVHMVLGHAREIQNLVVKYGTQGNVPQRAAIILDYFERIRMLPQASATVVELGCSAGLLGMTLCQSEELFVRHNGLLAKEYFWLKRMPHITVPYDITYIGYDKVIPPLDLVPFFVWDTERRKKVASFARTFKTKGVLFEKPFDPLLDVRRIESQVPVIFLTAFVMYQLARPEELQRKIMGLVHTHKNVHWLDLSRNSNLECLFGKCDASKLVQDHVYLSHNSVPVAHVIHGSDDCPDWEYL